MKEEEREQFGVVLSATLTLLGLLIAFSFSMAVSRYDQRKNYEEAEANSDIDSPRSGAIRVVPQNLVSLSRSLHAQN